MLPVIILTFFPGLLTSELPNGGSSTIGTVFLERGILYVLNVVFVILLSKDMKQLRFRSPLILIATFLSSIIGVSFFLLLATEKVLKKNNI